MQLRSFLQHWRQDLPASIVVFLVALPLCLGIALASGAPLISGLVAGIVGGLVVGSFSGSSLGVSGPAAGLTVIVLGAVAELGSFELFLTAAIIAGGIQVALGLLRAGVVAYYFPSAVIEGMLAAIGIIIFLKQVPHAFGYDADYEGDISFLQADAHNTFSELYHMLGAISPGATIIAAVSLGILLLWERGFIKRKPVLSAIPGPLLAVLAGIGLGALFTGSEAMRLTAAAFVDMPSLSLGNLRTALPRPEMSGFLDPLVWKTALTIAIVASLETLLCVEATDKMDPQKRITPTDRELWAQGIGNSLSGLAGGLPVTQVIVRSSANIQSGGRTKLSAIVHGGMILLAVLLLPGVIRAIPLASLAAILLVVGYKLARPAQFIAMFRAGKRQFVPFICTVVGVVFTDLLIGVLIGLTIGVFRILYNNYRVPFHFDPKAYVPGKPVRIELSEDVSFLNKAGIMRTLSTLPRGAHVVLDATRTVDLHPDVREIVADEQVRAAEQGITIELIGLDDQRTPPRSTHLPQQVAHVAAQQNVRTEDGTNGRADKKTINVQ